MRSPDLNHRGITLGDISDGTSNTFFCGETLSYAALQGNPFGSTHFIADSIEHNQLTNTQWAAGELRGTYQRLFSRNDGQVVGEF